MNDEIIVDVACMEHLYPGGVRIDVCGVEFQVRRGQRVVVLGPNGAGKSTLLKHILGLLKPTQGTVQVFGIDPARHYQQIRGRIGALLQNADEQLIGPTVLDDIAFAPLNFGYSRAETLRRTEAILHALDIDHLRNRLPHFLSGGERKKVALAGALVIEPELLVMDEPLAGIDAGSRQEISQFLADLHRKTGMTMISTTHDMDTVSELADTGYLMRQGGQLALYGALDELFFDHDLRDYNLIPPLAVQLVKALQAHGLHIPRTLDAETVIREVVAACLRGQTS